jgi:hypothetical protein
MLTNNDVLILLFNAISSLIISCWVLIIILNTFEYLENTWWFDSYIDTKRLCIMFDSYDEFHKLIKP